MIDSLGKKNAGLTFDIGHANTNGLVFDFLAEINMSYTFISMIIKEKVMSISRSEKGTSTGKRLCQNSKDIKAGSLLKHGL